MAGEIGSRRIDLTTHGTFSVTIPAQGLTPNNNVVASITELNVDGHPTIGAATATIHNVVAQQDQITVRGSVDWDTDLRIRVTVMNQ